MPVAVGAQGCAAPACNANHQPRLHACAGKHVVAVLKILDLVLDKLPAAFSGAAKYRALCHLVALLGRLPAHHGCAAPASMPARAAACRHAAACCAWCAAGLLCKCHADCRKVATADVLSLLSPAAVAGHVRCTGSSTITCWQCCAACRCCSRSTTSSCWLSCTPARSTCCWVSGSAGMAVQACSSRACVQCCMQERLQGCCQPLRRGRRGFHCALRRCLATLLLCSTPYACCRFTCSLQTWRSGCLICVRQQ